MMMSFIHVVFLLASAGIVYASSAAAGFAQFMESQSRTTFLPLHVPNRVLTPGEIHCRRRPPAESARVRAYRIRILPRRAGSVRRAGFRGRRLCSLGSRPLRTDYAPRGGPRRGSHRDAQVKRPAAVQIFLVRAHVCPFVREV